MGVCKKANTVYDQRRNRKVTKRTNKRGYCNSFYYKLEKPDKNLPKDLLSFTQNLKRRPDENRSNFTRRALQIFRELFH